MKTNFKKYIKHSCLSGLIFGLVSISATQMAVGAACKMPMEKVDSCDKIAYVISPKKDSCMAYYTADMMQCVHKPDTHQCMTGTKLKCTLPKTE
jgi:hypothetical protein